MPSGRRLRARRWQPYTSKYKAHPIPEDTRMECLNCGEEFDPIACRWKCPACQYKHDCCDGAPQ